MKRIRLLYGLILIFLLLIVLRLFWLQIVRHRFFQEKSLKQRTRIINLAANRGDIMDRNGEILASSIDTYSVFTQDEGFDWVARKLPPAEAEKLKSADPGRYFIFKEKKRIYPKGSFASQLVGFVGSDDQGLSGIELSLDKYLMGKAGRVVTEGDREGRELYGALREIEPGEEGMNVTLTIDGNIQYAAEKAITEQIRQYHAASGTLIVMNAKTGEILALASKPDFDPNQYAKSSRTLWHPRFLDPYEPGSTFKLITVASGLEERVITPDSKLKALNRIEIGGKVIENSHAIRWDGAEVSVARVLEESINTGTVQIGLKLGPEKFYRRMRDFGFGEPTGFGLAGESRGILRYWENWYKPDVAMTSFGQSVAVTPMQLLSAVSAFANGGQTVRPYLIKKIESVDGKFVKVYAGEKRGRAVSGRAAAEMIKLMEKVVVNGSGRKARLDWFSVGGKTGTAQKALPGGRGYMKGHFIASFIGLAPLNDPRLVALVLVDDPRGVIWGETVCGPVFKDVVGFALRYLNVKPDIAIMAIEND